MNEKHNKFLDILKNAKESGAIKLLYRGVSKKFAFKSVGLYTKYNTLNQFQEKLFFFGEKSKYFWNEKLKTRKYNFTLNDTSDDFFKFIFNDLSKLINSFDNPATGRYFKRNSSTVEFFKEIKNIDLFIKKINKLNDRERTIVRNYYLRIIHQLGESEYKENSSFVSSSKNKFVAKKFSKNGIIINFWDFNFGNYKPEYDIPLFMGKPYKNQSEISIFGVILPHYIYSFKYKNKLYPNPAINDTNDLQGAILGGLDINQENFKERLHTETIYTKGVTTEGRELKEF